MRIFWLTSFLLILIPTSGNCQVRQVLGQLLTQEGQQAIVHVDVFAYAAPDSRTRPNEQGFFQLDIPEALLAKDSIRIVIKFDETHAATGFVYADLDTSIILMPPLLDLDYTNFFSQGKSSELRGPEPKEKDTKTRIDTVRESVEVANSSSTKIPVNVNGEVLPVEKESLLTGLHFSNYSLGELLNTFQNLNQDFLLSFIKIIKGIDKVQNTLDKSLVLSPGQILELRNVLDYLDQELAVIKTKFQERDIKYQVLVQKAQEEIRALQEFLAEDSNFVRVHKYLYYSIMAALFGLFFLLLLFVFMTYQLRKRRKELISRNQTIDEKSKEILGINEKLATQKDRLEYQRARLKNYLEEIHHRVKNHLQRTSSLLDLSMASGQPVGQIIENIRGRIYSMALIHKKLQNTDNLDQVNLKDYLEELIGSVSNTLSPPDKEITCSAHIAPVLLDISTATDLGLIVHELVSNAYKYAFEGRTSGTIEVEIQEAKQDTFQLQVRDDGRGLPEGIHLESTHTLGLSLTRVLAERMQGRVELTAHPGSTFTVYFCPKSIFFYENETRITYVS